MSTQPFLPLFFGDLLASTPTWEGEERALYIVLLAYQWTAGALPKDPKKIARMCQYEQKTFSRLWPVVSKKFVDGGDGLVNPRLEEHRDRASEISNARSGIGRVGGLASAEARRQAKLKQNDKQTGSKIEPIASDLLPANFNHPSHPIPKSESKSGSAAPPLDPRKQLFELGKTILGANSGGLISKAIAATDESTVGAVLGEMALKATADPRAYFAAATKTKERGLVA